MSALCLEEGFSPTSSLKSGRIIIYIFLVFLCTIDAKSQILYTDSGKVFDFKSIKKNQASILIFFDPECPVCQKYTKNLIEIEQKYAKEGIKLYVVYPFKPIDSTTLAEFRQEYRFDSPIIYDSKRVLLKKLKANYTPEVYLLSNKRKTLYHGAIDNWFYGLGRNRAAPTEFYLFDAIQAYKTKKPIKVKYVEPVGCGL